MKKAFLITGSVLALTVASIAAAWSVKFVYRTFNPYLDVEVSRDITLSTDWMELRPAKPLVAQRQVQLLIVSIPPGLTADRGNRGLRRPDGTLIEFQVELIDQQGHNHQLHVGALGDEEIGFSEWDIPDGTAFPVVRIRASNKIIASRIYWRCYNSWDLK